jgi:pantothenate kinase type III
MILDIDVGNTYVKWRLSTELEVIKRGSQKTDSLLCGQQLNLGSMVSVSQLLVLYFTETTSSLVQ